jgi:hypothetical protein
VRSSAPTRCSFGPHWSNRQRPCLAHAFCRDYTRPATGYTAAGAMPMMYAGLLSARSLWRAGPRRVCVCV